MKKNKKGKKGGKAQTFDFSDVEKRGKARIPEGDYPFKVTDCEEGEGDKGPYYKVIAKISSGKHKGFSAWIYLSHSTLWKMAQFLEACGVEVPKGELTLSTKDFLGLEFAGTVEDEEYEGKTRSKVQDFFSIEDLDDKKSSDDDEEESDEEDSEEDEEDDEEDSEDDDDDEDEEVDDDEDDEDDEEEESVKKKGKKKKK